MGRYEQSTPDATQWLQLGRVPSQRDLRCRQRSQARLVFAFAEAMRWRGHGGSEVSWVFISTCIKDETRPH